MAFISLAGDITSDLHRTEPAKRSSVVANNLQTLPQIFANVERTHASVGSSFSDHSVVSDSLPDAIHQKKRESTSRAKEVIADRVYTPEVVNRDAHSTSRALLRDQPSLLQFMFQRLADQRRPSNEVATRGAGQNWLSLRNHVLNQASNELAKVLVSDVWTPTADDIRSGVNDTGDAIDLEERIAAVARFIDSFPRFEDENVFLTTNERECGVKEILLEERVRVFKMGYRGGVAHLSKTNRLDDSWSGYDVHEICEVMYEMKDEHANKKHAPKTDVAEATDGSETGGEDACEDEPSLPEYVGCIEAALMAWDLTSNIQDAWRVPLTIVTVCAGRRFSYVCVLLYIHVGNRIAVVGRCSLKELSYVSLARRRASDVVKKFAEAFVTRGHALKSIHLGLPSEHRTPDNAACHVIWRLLKLSCVRQEWMSVLATCDNFVAQRRAIRRAVIAADGRARANLPRGFGFLRARHGKIRLKAVPPLMVKRLRLPRRRPLPPLGSVDFPCLISDSGAWKGTDDEIRCSLFGDMDLHGARNVEVCSSVSSDSLDEFEEDHALRHVQPLRVEELQSASSPA